MGGFKKIASKCGWMEMSKKREGGEGMWTTTTFINLTRIFTCFFSRHLQRNLLLIYAVLSMQNLLLSLLIRNNSELKSLVPPGQYVCSVARGG